MIRRVLLAAILAGIVAGLIVSAVQLWRVVPLILEAEKYETAEAAHGHATATTAAAESHEAEAWAPAEGFERAAYTVAANIIAGAAFALVAAAASILTGLPVTVGNGALWGLAGFAVFTLAPSAGLPPELPGMPAGDLVSRQVWWWSTAGATAAGIGLLALTRHFGLKAAGVAVMALPHLIGAPQPVAHESSVPASLANAFAANVIVTSAIFWLVLGLALGILLTRAQQLPRPA